MRKSFIAGNWKMNGLQEDVKIKLGQLKSNLENNKKDLDVVICPSFTVLSTAKSVVSGSKIKIGAQDCHFNLKGAHTGDVSATMLKDVGCEYVILGHSERRANHGETNTVINAKTKAAIESGLVAIVCIGETKDEKEAGKTIEVVEKQLKESLPEIINDKNTVIAYEPVWAIGTGLVPTLEDIQEVHAKVRSIISKLTSKEVSDKIRILYGGSLNAANSKDILSLADVDGGLIGGASLIVEDFTTIINNSR
jgi:triosephosphate isomerase